LPATTTPASTPAVSWVKLGPISITLPAGPAMQTYQVPTPYITPSDICFEDQGAGLYHAVTGSGLVWLTSLRAHNLTYIDIICYRAS